MVNWTGYHDAGGQRPTEYVYGEYRWEVTTTVPLLLPARPTSVLGESNTSLGPVPAGLRGRGLQ